jgi:hypothetical protein
MTVMSRHVNSCTGCLGKLLDLGGKSDVNVARPETPNKRVCMYVCMYTISRDRIRGIRNCRQVFAVIITMQMRRILNPIWTV